MAEIYRHDVNLASIGTKRSLFKIPHNYKTTFNAGDLIPVACMEVLPGDSFSIKVSAVIRELTLLNPVMDNSYIQLDAFFVPWRIIWNKTKQFFGENETGIWTQTNEYELPSTYASAYEGTNTIELGTLGDYFGLPIMDLSTGDQTDEETFNTLPLCSYFEIYNYYYLAETTQAPILYDKDSCNEFDERVKEGYNSKPLKVNRFADLFTTALPQPQKSKSVPFLSDYLPVVPVSATNLPEGNPTISDALLGDELNWMPKAGGSSIAGSGNLLISTGKTTFVPGSGGTGTEVIPGNLYASTISQGLNTINGLRIAIATQQYYEQLARGGSRYHEYIKGLYGVSTSAETINIPQYLGSIKKLINVTQVLSTADSSSAILGTTGAFSNTAFGNEHLFTASFTEFGYILILAHVRTDNTYSQGIPKLFSKKTKFEISNPLFANIGNVGIRKKELYFGNNTEKDNEIFGYAEAWYEYKHMPNKLTGYMRPGVDNSFSSWTYGRVFESHPVLNSDFTLQTSEEVDRTIAVQSQISNQFKFDLFLDTDASRIMPLYGIPGLKRV